MKYFCSLEKVVVIHIVIVIIKKSIPLNKIMTKKGRNNVLEKNDQQLK